VVAQPALVWVLEQDGSEACKENRPVDQGEDVKGSKASKDAIDEQRRAVNSKPNMLNT
jgi:hypothetical protein